ncbi:MAG TPA: class I tRNA ligase family protein, partial [Fimbriimonadaceae bacterium]|nr:class I tRNA ligase family protein [Fimbriimonadaceae bacterium]
DPEFGTGAVKITPAHDPNDFEVGVRHNLSMPVLLDESAKITEEGGKYAGMDRFEARKAVVADLEEQGFLVKIEDHEIPLLVSERSGEPIEPLLSDEWFCKQGELAKVAMEASKSGRVKFVPERYASIFEDWLENIRDWNISRRLWWGHRIPVYYTEDGTGFAAMSWDDAQAKAGDAKIVRQDEDVLDTWFSSGLWPFATMGWPNTSEDLATYYPTNLLVTAKDIIFLWVARMVMMGVDFIGDVPFRDVYIYATVLTEDGRRMSKSLGTGVDPMTIIETKGADALRYTLLSQTGYNQDIRYSDRRTDDARNFCNKIWNAVRFVLMNVDESASFSPHLETGLQAGLADVDKWLLSRLYATEKIVSEAYETYDCQSAAQALYKFFWSELCDWYIEVAKPRLNDPEQRQVPQQVLLTCFDAFVKMMHPIMPHITEEVYSHLPLTGKSPFLMSASWPELPAWYADSEVEAKVERLFDVVRELRALRAAVDIGPGQSVPTAYFEGAVGATEAVLAAQGGFGSAQRGRPAVRCFSGTLQGIDLHLPLDGLVDEAKLRDKIDKDLAKTADDLAKLSARLNNPDFVSRAKPEIIERDRSLESELKEKLAKLEERRSLLT